MPNLPATAGFAGGWPERRAAREIVRSRTSAAIVSTREIGRVEVVGQVTEAALLATSHVSAIEALLVARTPHAEARLRHIADAGCAGMASIVMGVGHRV